MAADLAAMAPGTNIGAAHPVSSLGPMDEITAKKAASHIAAYVRSTAAGRGRPPEIAEEAVLESRSFTEREALEANLIDLTAVDVEELLRALHGRSVRRFDGTEAVLDLTGHHATRVPMSWREIVLDAVASPPMVFLLLMGALAGIGTEMSHPGLVLPGVVGVFCLILFLMAGQVLPISIAGVLLIVLAVALFAAEVKVTSYGLLTAGGIAALVLGAMMLVDAPLPELRVPLGTALPAALVTAAWSLLVVRLVLRSRRMRVTTGGEGLIGETAVAETDLAPEGWVFVKGARWRAVAATPVGAGQRVRVTRLAGLTLSVEKEA
jgi:membrane-bound serine protease (ClpP class)